MSHPGTTFSKISLLCQRLLTTACKNPGGLRPILGHALAEAGNHLDHAIDIARVPSIPLSVLAKEKGVPLEIAARLYFDQDFAVRFEEAVALGVLLRSVDATRVFEIGTNRGVSTAQLALNVPEDGQVFSLDLPRDNRQTKFTIVSQDLEVANQLEKADLLPEHLRSRVTFLEHDSATFDETPYIGNIDAVFVDGAHTYDYVRSDSEKSWRMLRPGGVIIWHDFCPQFPDVMRYILESNLSAKLVDYTTVAFAFKPK